MVCERMRITLRNLRVIIAIALGGVVVWAMAPYATSYVSSNAVVNAPLNTVLSPMQGRITQRSPPVGTRVAAGAPLVTIEVKERDRRYLEDLRARLAMLGEHLASAEVEAAKLAAMEEILSARIRSYRTRTLARLAAAMREAEAALAAAEAGRDNAAATLRRAETLVRQGHATAMRVEADLPHGRGSESAQSGPSAHARRLSNARAGFPTTTCSSSTFRITTAPDPTTASRPIFKFGFTTAFAPMVAPEQT